MAAAGAVAPALLRAASWRPAARAGWRRHLSLCAAGLRPLETNIGLGLRGRLEGLERWAEGPSRVAVVGRHSAEFAAALRAARSVGAVAVPVDARRCDQEEIMERLAEAQVQLAISAGAPGAERTAAHEAARLLGAPAASAQALHGEGLNAEPIADEADAPQEPPLLLFSTPPHTCVARAAEVPQRAVSARIEAAIRTWGFTEGDVVLSLGLSAEEQAAVVDAVEAPLAAGARVAIPELGHAAEGEVWDMWAALRDEEATVVFVASEWCLKLLDAHEKLAGPVRAQLEARWAERPLRHTVALAPRGTVLSKETSERWARAFGCPLTWHFSCSEAGSLLTVRSCAEDGPQAWVHEGRCAEGLRWRVEEDELWVAGEALFERYHGRPRSTEEAFDAEDGFWRTFHRVAPGGPEAGSMLPLPNLIDMDLEKRTEAALRDGPEPHGGPAMMPDWKVRKVPMRVYEIWRTAWKGLDVTKKHTTVHKVYVPKYKRRRKL